MQVSLENVSNLGRKIKVTIPSQDVQTAIEAKIKEIAKKIRIDGFRPGKVPLSLVKKRYESSIRDEVFQDKIRTTLQEALSQHALEPAAWPKIEITQENPLEYTALFDILPAITLPDFSEVEVVREVADIKELDVEKVLKRLRKQFSEWNDTDRAAEEGDLLSINFEGSVDGELFEGGKAEKMAIEIGSGSLIPGFEEQLKGTKVGTHLQINVTFPEDYRETKLAGKNAVFATEVLQIQERKLPALDEEFAKKLGITDGGMTRLRDEVKRNMERELKTIEYNKFKVNVMDKLYEMTALELPDSLVQQEFDTLKRQALDRVRSQIQGYSQNNKELDKLVEDMVQLNEENVQHLQAQAKKRVALGLILSEYLKQKGIKVEEERVRTKIRDLSELYQDPRQAEVWLSQDKNKLAEVQSVVMEEQIVDHLMQSARIIEKTTSYDKITQTDE